MDWILRYIKTYLYICLLYTPSSNNHPIDVEQEHTLQMKNKDGEQDYRIISAIFTNITLIYIALAIVTMAVNSETMLHIAN